MLQGLLHGVGNAFVGGRAFGDPTETFQRYAPMGLLDSFDEDQQRQYGERLQSQLRTPGMSRSGIQQGFQQGLVSEQEQQAAQQRQEQMRNIIQPQQQPQGGQQYAGLLSPQQGPQGAPPQQGQQPTWQGLLQTGEQLMREGFHEEGMDYLNQARHLEGLSDPQQVAQEREQQQNRQAAAFGALDQLVQNGSLDPQRAELLKARPLEEIEEAVFGQFSLSAGQQRFDAMGNPVAAAGTTNMQDQDAGIPVGQFSLSAGQQRFDADGNPIAAVGTANMQDQDAGIASGSGDDYELQIRRIQESNPGVTREQAANIVNGSTIIRQDPVTGRNFTVNQATGEQTPIQSTTEDPSMPQGKAALTPEEFNLESSLGLTGSWRRPVNAVSDFFTGDAAFPDTQKTNTALSQIRNDVTALIADKFSGRVSEQRLKLIQEAFTVDPNQLFSGQGQARQTLEQTRNQLNRLAEDEAAKLRDPYPYPASEVSAARNTVQQLANRVADIDVILGSTAPQQTPSPQTSAPAQTGADPIEDILNRYE